MLARFALHEDRTLFLFVFATDVNLPKAMNDLSEQKRCCVNDLGPTSGKVGVFSTNWIVLQDIYFDRVSQIKMKNWSKGRVALVGDAAFCASLMAGQGAALAMTAAYILAGELANASGRHEAAFRNYEGLLRAYIGSKQAGAERFSAAFAPKSRWGLFLRNQVIRACAIPGLARLAFGRDIIDTLQLPVYAWPALASTAS